MSRTSPQAAATPSGVMASRASRPPLADTDETARERLEKAFRDWGEAIGAALTRLRDNGLLPVDADLPALTTATLASLQGGLLLSKTARDSQPLRIALHAAISYLAADSRRPRTAGVTGIVESSGRAG